MSGRRGVDTRHSDIVAASVHVAFFGAVRVVLGADNILKLVEEFFCHDNLTILSWIV